MPSHKIISVLLILVPLGWIIARVIQNKGEIAVNSTNNEYLVNYNYTIRGDADYWIKTYIPQSDDRQKITVRSALDQFKVEPEGDNQKITWLNQVEGIDKLELTIQFKGRPVEFQVSEAIPYGPNFDLNYIDYNQATTLIQADSEELIDLSNQLRGAERSLINVIAQFYDYVYDLPSTGTNELTDALSAFQEQEASCNGKSRLLVALCRTHKIPARMVGGIILQQTEKKTSHAWTEVLINDTWVPFDPLNGHFASLPANYLKIYSGDHFLITRSTGINFDYEYQIREKRDNVYANMSLVDLWGMIDRGLVNKRMLIILVLLPLGALLIGILKSVVGLKTIGVFLPVLISLSLTQTGVVSGLILFTFIVLVVAAMSYPMTYWGIQHTAKLTTLMTVVVLSVLGLMLGLSHTGLLEVSTPLFFPLIMLTIVAEKVARMMEEDGMKVAFDVYGQTLMASLIIFVILNSKAIQTFLITFPEAILIIAGVNLLLGKWIGMRVLEYKRFFNAIAT